MPFGDRVICLDLRRDALLPQRTEAARNLLASAPTLRLAFEEFKQNEAGRLPKWADQIRKLEVDLIGLYARDDPAYGEVYFTPESGNDMWFCGLTGGRFERLVLES